MPHFSLLSSHFSSGNKTSTHKVPNLSFLLSALHPKQEEHFVSIFDCVVKTYISPETNNISETANFIYLQEQKQVKQRLCES